MTRLSLLALHLDTGAYRSSNLSCIIMKTPLSHIYCKKTIEHRRSIAVLSDRTVWDLFFEYAVYPLSGNIQSQLHLWNSLKFKEIGRGLEGLTAPRS